MIYAKNDIIKASDGSDVSFRKPRLWLKCSCAEIYNCSCGHYIKFQFN